MQQEGSSCYLLSPSFLPWHSPSHPPDPGFSCPVAATEASQVSPGEEPFALLPTLSPWGGLRLSWMVLPGSSSGPVLFPCCSPGGSAAAVSVSFPPCPADPLKTGSVSGA